MLDGQPRGLLGIREQQLSGLQEHFTAEVSDGGRSWWRNALEEEELRGF